MCLLAGVQQTQARRGSMRRLSAIMFTDMVGYTALMQEDESRATTLRDRHRTVLREGIEARQGEIVQVLRRRNPQCVSERGTGGGRSIVQHEAYDGPRRGTFS